MGKDAGSCNAEEARGSSPPTVRVSPPPPQRDALRGVRPAARHASACHRAASPSWHPAAHRAGTLPQAHGLTCNDRRRSSHPWSLPRRSPPSSAAPSSSTPPPTSPSPAPTASSAAARRALPPAAMLPCNFRPPWPPHVSRSSTHLPPLRTQNPPQDADDRGDGPRRGLPPLPGGVRGVRGGRRARPPSRPTSPSFPPRSLLVSAPKPHREVPPRRGRLPRRVHRRDPSGEDRRSGTPPSQERLGTQDTTKTTSSRTRRHPACLCEQCLERCAPARCEQACEKSKAVTSQCRCYLAAVVTYLYGKDPVQARKYPPPDTHNGHHNGYLLTDTPPTGNPTSTGGGVLQRLPGD